MSSDCALLKNKTLLVFNTTLADEFYNAYSFKKEKVDANDISKITSKDKKYCYLRYNVYPIQYFKQVSIIDCETQKIIYQKTYVFLSSMSLGTIPKKYAEDLNSAVNGKYIEDKK